jgi:nicotinamide-nucleotide amidase
LEFSGTSSITRSYPTVIKSIYDILGENIYGEDDDTLESVIAELLAAKKLTLACAESCTGGMVASKLINYPGISGVLKEGLITYSNEAKMNRLGVSEKLLAEHGAVSAEVAAAMAEGAAVTSGADVGLATTGIAGPSGATETKPVGLVYLGLYIKGKPPITHKPTLTGTRERIRVRATISALDFLRTNLMKE